MSTEPAKPAPEGTPPPAANPAPAAPGEETVTLTQKQLAERTERAVRSFLKKELGLDSAEAAKEVVAKKGELEKAEEERRQAALTEQQKLQEQLNQATARAAKAEAAAEQARVDLHLSRLFAKHGVTNVDYATWKIMDAVNKLPESEELDEEKFLAELLANPVDRAALGVAPVVTPPTPQVAVPSTTTTPPGAAPKPPPAGNPPPAQSAFEMAPDAWAKKKAELGIA